MSRDKIATQKKFDDKHNLSFPLLSDETGDTIDAYGSLIDKKNKKGEIKKGILRSSFLIDEKQKIVAAWYKVKPNDTVPLAIEAATN